jgi:hypothetical protein
MLAGYSLSIMPDSKKNKKDKWIINGKDMPKSGKVLLRCYEKTKN